MFFDNQHFFRFRDACRQAGIEVPIVPGLKPITKKYQLTSIPRKFFINFPEQLVQEVISADDKFSREIGIEWCVQQCLELKREGVPCLHFYTMGDVDTTYKIVEKIA
jgi:methylenetetrahydrofolate reductase (NADPH)